MIKRLLKKFTQLSLWLLAGLLASTPTMASGQLVADTCRHPEPPVIVGSTKDICRSESVTLTATGCTGEVVWSNGEIGNKITVRPQQTTKYTAICRAKQGCISCFADVWKVTVNTPDAPVLTAASSLVCAGDVVTITAKNCAGTVRWQDQSTGLGWTGKLTESTVFNATCEQNNCVSNASTNMLVQVASPTVPVVSVDKAAICVGQSVQLTATNCIGKVLWSDGGEGRIRSVSPATSVSYRAVCQIGSCRSDSSLSVPVAIRPANIQVRINPTLTNACPYLTADLSKAINSSNANLHYLFRTGPSIETAAVQSPGAVKAGTYYVFGRNADGCYTAPNTIAVQIVSCENAIPPCLSNPATVAVRLDSVNWSKGVITLQGQLGGSAESASWQSTGGGLFTNESLQARYLLSEADRQAGNATFTLVVPDPDGTGPCVGASAQANVALPVTTREIVGLSKKVSEPVWVSEAGVRLIELAYQFTVVNLGKHPLTQVQIADDLEPVFMAAGARIHSVAVRTDRSLTASSAYKGYGADTTLLTGADQLPAGGQAKLWLTVRVDVSQASTLTFANKAFVKAVDANGGICSDESTNGTEADPDQNGDPADNKEPTSVTLHSLRPEETETVFIPEGFSPNGDGINDRFVIQRIPAGVTAQVEIFNRWGHAVYRSNDYKNDWDGTANQGLKTAEAKQGLPDGTYYYQIRLSDGREFVRFLMLSR